MKEVRGDLWRHKADVRIITTNGFVKANGEAVMGRGCALEASKRFPTFPDRLGRRLWEMGNVVHQFEFIKDDNLIKIITFPVKHHWYQDADLDLIRESTAALMPIVLADPDVTFVMPRPGCGNGKLKWIDVKPLLAHLPDNVHVITFQGL